MTDYKASKRIVGTSSERTGLTTNYDTLGTSANGTNSGITLISGIQKYADLDGSNDYINLGGSASDWNLFHAPSGSCEYSVSMWIKLDTVQYTQVFTTEDNTESNGVVMYVNSATQVGIQTWYGGSQHSTTITTSTWEAGKWYHLVITRNGGTFKIYKDGTEYTGSTSATGSTNDASYVPRISGNHGQTAYRLDGGVSQVIVYTDQLTQSEVTELYNSGTPVSDPTTLDSDGGSIKAWYKFESDANDSHGSLNGTATGVTWVSDAFKLGSGAYSFDGTNDKVETGDKFGFLTQTGSIAFWMKPTTFNDNDVLFDSCNASSSNSGVLCKVASSSNLITFLIARGGSSSNLNYTFGSNPSGKWTHLAFTYDGTTAKIYENGSEVASGSVTSTTNTPTHNLHFGEAGAGQDGNYDGLFDDIGIWNRVLTATEIGKLANNNGAGYLTKDAQATTNTSSSGTTLTNSSFTVANNSNRILIVCAYRYGSGGDISGITWNSSESFTRATFRDGSTETGRTEIWYLVNPTATTANVVTTWDASTDRRIAGVYSFYNAKQTSPIGATAYDDEITTVTDGAITPTEEGSMIVDCIGSGSNGAPNDSLTAGWSVLIGGDDRIGASQYKVNPTIGSANTMAWTFASDKGVNWIAVEVKSANPTGSSAQLASSLSDTSGLKAYYSMDTNNSNTCPNDAVKVNPNIHSNSIWEESNTGIHYIIDSDGNWTEVA